MLGQRVPLSGRVAEYVIDFERPRNPRNAAPDPSSGAASFLCRAQLYGGSTPPGAQGSCMQHC